MSSAGVVRTKCLIISTCNKMYSNQTINFQLGELQLVHLLPSNLLQSKIKNNPPEERI